MHTARISLRSADAGITRPRRTWTPAAALAILLAVGFALRAYVVFTQTFVVFPDETFQYLEQAHRLVSGSGVVPWEFIDGVRSWFLPGILAGMMWAARLIGPGPEIYLHVIRLFAAAFSLSVVVVGFRMVGRRDGLTGALLTAILCVFWSELLFFSPTVLTEALAGNCALLGILCDDAGERPPRRLMTTGAWFGLAVCLRFQYAPALLAAALWQHRLAWRDWLWLAAGGLAVLLPVGGLLDWATWGSPFQSIWLNVVRNTVQGVSGSMGTYTWDFYPEYLAETFQPGAAVMIVLAVVGATRLPALAVAVVVTVAVHSLVPHKEFRFVYLAVAASPILIGAGASALFCRIRPRAGRIATAAVLAVTCLLSAAGSYATATHGQLAARWVHNRDYLDAFLAAHRAPDLCALGVSGVHRFRSGGYAYLDRQVPLYYSDYEPVSWRPGATVPMRLEVVLAGRPVSEPAKDTLALASARFNYLVAPPDGGFDGFTPTACFDTDDTPVCLFRRPGGCDP